MSTDLDCHVALLRDGATDWFADVRIPAWQLEIHAMPVTGTSESEAAKDAIKWVGTNLQALHTMVHQLGPGTLNLVNPTDPTYTPRKLPDEPYWWHSLMELA